MAFAVVKWALWALVLVAAAVARPASAQSEPRPEDKPPPRLTLAVDDDEAIEVVLGPAESAASIVYMHGVCGDPMAFESWVRAAVAHATFVSMRGDLPCKSRSGRRKWSLRLPHLHARIGRALQAASARRKKPLDPRQVTLVGYSQGASRVEALAAAFPEHYRRVALVAIPREPSPARLARTERVLLVAGAWDARAHMRRAAERLARGGKPALYLELPKARHGEYGPEAERVMRRGLDWLFNGRASD